MICGFQFVHQDIALQQQPGAMDGGLLCMDVAQLSFSLLSVVQTVRRLWVIPDACTVHVAIVYVAQRQLYHMWCAQRR